MFQIPPPSPPVPLKEDEWAPYYPIGSQYFPVILCLERLAHLDHSLHIGGQVDGALSVSGTIRVADVPVAVVAYDSEEARENRGKGCLRALKRRRERTIYLVPSAERGNRVLIGDQIIPFMLVSTLRQQQY